MYVYKYIYIYIYVFIYISLFRTVPRQGYYSSTALVTVHEQYLNLAT